MIIYFLIKKISLFLPSKILKLIVKNLYKIKKIYIFFSILVLFKKLRKISFFDILFY